MNQKFQELQILCEAQKFIFDNKRGIIKEDYDILNKLENVMDNYNYGWHIYEDDMFTQIKMLVFFQTFILNHANDLI